jgi:5-hydroxyisourate hydrolase
VSGSVLSLHVLDTTCGGPGAGMRVELHRVAPDPAQLAAFETDADGRAPAPLLPPEGFVPGSYELRYHVADYFRARGVALPEPPFLDVVPVRFALPAGAGHYHVPLQVTPWAYATYRGS